MPNERASKVFQFDLRKIAGRMSTGNPNGVLDVAADSRQQAIGILSVWLDALCDETVVTDVTKQYCEIAEDNADVSVEADIGNFNLVEWALSNNAKTTAATVAV